MASKRTENIIIFTLAGVMLFSSVGTGLLLLADDDGEDNTITTTTDAQTNDTTQPAPNEPDAFIPEGDVTELGITDLTEGEGVAVKAGDTITVNYHGTLASDGTVFDSSYRRGEPISFPLDGVIEGWREGIPGMKVGGVRRLVIPSDLAYGVIGSPPTIGPNADLVFQVELISIDN